MRVCFHLAGLAVIPAFSDIVNVQFNQQPSGSGDVLVRCDTYPGGAGSGTTIVVSSSPTSFVGTTSFTDISGRSATVTNEISQDNASTSTSIGIDVMEKVLISGVGGEWSAMGTDADPFNAEFTLTTESLLDLNTMEDIAPLFLQLEDSNGNVLYDFPTNLSRASTSITLAPGTYQIAGDEVLQVGGGPAGISTSEEFQADLSLSADFTTVPEPAGMPVLLLTLFGTIVLLRRPQKAQ